MAHDPWIPGKKPPSVLQRERKERAEKLKKKQQERKEEEEKRRRDWNRIDELLEEWKIVLPSMPKRYYYTTTASAGEPIECYAYNEGTGEVLRIGR